MCTSRRENEVARHNKLIADHGPSKADVVFPVAFVIMVAGFVFWLLPILLVAAHGGYQSWRTAWKEAITLWLQ